MKIFGIPLTVDMSFFFVAVFLGFSRLNEPFLLAQWVAVVLVSVVVHELGHAFMSRAFGHEPEVRLYAMGGVTTWRTTEDSGPGRHLLISLAGPAAGFVFGTPALLALIFIPELRGSSYELLFYDLVWVNYGWGILNLLPILPLDGGNAVRSGIEWLTGKDTERPALVVSTVFSVILFALAALNGFLWGAFLAAWFAVMNGGALLERKRETDEGPLRAELDGAWRALERNDGADAARIAEGVFAKARSSAVRRSASEALVYARLLQNDADGARRDLGRYTALFGDHPYLEGAVALARGETAKAIATLEELYQHTPRAQIARELCRAYVRDGRLDDAFALCEQERAEKFAPALYSVIAEEAFRIGAFDASARAAATLFSLTASPNAAYNAACAYARANMIDEAVAYLERAVSAGFDDASLVATDPDLEPVRAAAGYSRVLAALADAKREEPA